MKNIARVLCKKKKKKKITEKVRKKHTLQVGSLFSMTIRVLLTK
jgi:hypothetical protein